MARIRTIKPEFPQSETIGRLSRDARLLFIQLWTIVDDDGRARASSRMLASLLYPYDDDAKELIDAWLDELERECCVRRYTVDGSQYLDLPTWLKHQKIDHPSKSKLPAIEDGIANPREVSRSLAPDLGPVPRTSIMDQDQSSLRSDIAPEPKPAKPDPRGTRLPEDWAPTATPLSDALHASEFLKFRDYWRSVPGARGRKLDWEATWRNWLRTAAERANSRAPPSRGGGFAKIHADLSGKPYE